MNQTDKRPRKWTRNEIEALIRARLLDFAPPQALAGNKKWILSIEDIRQAGGEYLLNRNQTRCFLDWIGITENLWYHPTAVECIRLRYQKGDIEPVKLLSQGWRRRIRNAVTAEPSLSPREIVDQLAPTLSRNTVPGFLFREGKRILLEQYAQALADGTWGKTHDLYRPITHSGIFQKVIDRVISDKTSNINPSHLRRMISKYVTISKGHPRELLGQVLYYLSFLHWDFWSCPEGEHADNIKHIWPSVENLDKTRISLDFRKIAGIYAEVFNIPIDVFLQIYLVYSRLQLQELLPRRQPHYRLAFWTAAIVRQIAPEVHNSYSEWIKAYRYNILKKARFTANEFDSPIEYASHGTFRTFLH